MDAVPESRPGRFEQTQWSLVLAAAGSDGSDAEAALALLCQTYWFPRDQRADVAAPSSRSAFLSSRWWPLSRPPSLPTSESRPQKGTLE